MIRFAAAAITVTFLAACGGGSDWGSQEGKICKEALTRLGNVPAGSLDSPLVNSALYDTAYGRLVDFFNGEDRSSPRYVSYGSCQIAGTVVLQVTVPGGRVIQGP